MGRESFASTIVLDLVEHLASLGIVVFLVFDGAREREDSHPLPAKDVLLKGSMDRFAICPMMANPPCLFHELLVDRNCHGTASSLKNTTNRRL
jgi:hypothetical protein